MFFLPHPQPLSTEWRGEVDDFYSTKTLFIYPPLHLVERGAGGGVR
jgi:hypothetical protein